jgi:hypothetical protein
MRKTGEEPPTRQFPSVEVCESYTSVMFERESSDRFSHKRADPCLSYSDCALDSSPPRPLES